MCLQRVDCTGASNTYSSTLSVRSQTSSFAAFSLPHPLICCYDRKLLLTPETNVFPVSEGARSRHRTSAPWPWKLCRSCPLSTSQRAQVPSPLAVRIYRMWREESQYKNQQMIFKFTKKQVTSYIYTKDSFNLVKYFAINQSHKNNANLNTVYVSYEKK